VGRVLGGTVEKIDQEVEEEMKLSAEGLLRLVFDVFVWWLLLMLRSKTSRGKGALRPAKQSAGLIYGGFTRARRSCSEILTDAISDGIDAEKTSSCVWVRGRGKRKKRL
jgi:hypothetical protein